MPRGNDAAAALADLRGEYAGAGGSAEDLIASARAAWSPALRAAINTPRDTDEDGVTPVKVDLEKVQSKIGDGGVVLDAAKRGDYVIVVVETESGRTYKEALAASEVGFDKPRKRPSMPDPEDESPDRTALTERMRATSEAQSLARKAEEAAEEARKKVYEQHAKSQGASSEEEGSRQRQSSTKTTGSGSGQ